MFAIFAFSLALQTAHLEIGEKTLLVEIADRSETRSKGLKGRKKLAENEGMLFVFEKPETLFFWMKDTKIPLSIGFFDAEKTLIQIEHMEPNSTTFVPSKFPAQYALEVPQGWFEKNHIVPKTKFSFRKHPSQVR